MVEDPTFKFVRKNLAPRRFLKHRNRRVFC